MCGTLFFLRYSCVRWLNDISPSSIPQEIQRSLSCALAFAGSGTSTSGVFVFGADENPPTHANVFRLPSPKLSDCPPPIDKPAIARESRSDFTDQVFSTNGIKSESSSFSNAANAGDCLG